MRHTAIKLFPLLFCSILLSGSCLAAKRGITLVKSETSQTRVVTGGSYRALVIGNNNYQDPEKRWNMLTTAATDAQAVSNVLKSTYGFTDVTLLKNASRKDVLQALTRLSKRVMPNDSVLVYYAGHGYLDPDTKKGYWVPVDARGFDSTTYLRNSTIRDELGTISSRAKHTLLISDSCFSGTLLRSDTRGVVPPENTDRYYNKVAGKKSVQIITAGGVEYVDDNFRDSGHSPFTYFLLNELNSNNKPVITASEMSGNLEKAVASNAEQTPESGVLQGAGDERGEFIFIRLKVDVDVTGIPKDQVKVKVHVTPETVSDTHTAEPVTTDHEPEKPVQTPDNVTNQAPEIVHFPTL
jgi:hypothetical protein